MHLKPEDFPAGPVDSWIVRSERETLYKFDESYSLFAINVRFQRLSDIFQFDAAKEGLQQSLERMDADEIEYFGGDKKIKTIHKYITS